MPEGSGERLRMAVAKYVRVTRQDRDWTQEDLAMRSGVRVGTISRLENCENGNLSTLGKVLEALKTEVCLVDNG